MKIPKTIKIGGFEYQIIESADVTHEGDCYGSLHATGQKIFLDPTEPQQHKEQVLIHEILHALMWQYGLERRLANKEFISEEDIVTPLSMAIYALLKDNNF